MTPQYLDHTVYPDVADPSELLEVLVTENEKADYLQRVCAAWDFDLYPEPATFALLRGWKEVFDRYPLSDSPAYHTFRSLFGWEAVPRTRNRSVHLTYEILDHLEGRSPDPCAALVQGATTAGFGAMGMPGKIDQPWQHIGKGKDTRPIPPGKLSDNPDVIAPAGKVHCSVGDWAKFAALHVTDGGKLLKSETLRKLHSPPFHGDYIGGWIAPGRPWGSGPVLTHNGSNTMNDAVAWLAPLKRFAVLVATNRMADDSPNACDDAASGVIERILLA